MKFRSRILAAALFVLPAGCASEGARFVDPFLDHEISGDDFRAHLARAYQHRVGVRKTAYPERIHAARFARKGYSVLHGKNVLPWDPAEWKVRPVDLPELAVARARLLSALDGGGRESFAQACARAQVHYDGWLEQARGDGPGGPAQPDFVAHKAEFYDAMPRCEGVIEPNKFVIYFGWAKVNLTEAAVALVDDIAGVAERFEAENVLVEGHADASGPARRNLALAEERALAVAAALQKKGVAVTGVRWFGEEHPAVSTGDGVREPLNRRVEVTLTR